MPVFWKRQIEVLFGNRQLTAPPLSIEFDLPFDNSSDTDAGHVRLYNLTAETIRKAKPGASIVVRAGYEGDVGTVWAGVISRATTSWSRVDKVTEFILSDTTSDWLSTRVRQTWAAGTKASTIVTALVRMTGLDLAALSLPNDISYESGKSVLGPVKPVLDEIAKDTGAKLYVERGRVYLVPPTYQQARQIVLNSQTGLLESPEPVVEEGQSEVTSYKVRCLLNHRILINTPIQLESRWVTGQYRVTKGRHIATDEDFVTELEVTA